MIVALGCTIHPSPKWIEPWSSALAHMTVVGTFLEPAMEALVLEDWLVEDYLD